MSTTPTTLYVWTNGGLSLADAVNAVTGQRDTPNDPAAKQSPLLCNPVGLFYSPTRCRFGLFRDGAFRDEFDQLLDLTAVFEARLFAERGELRWWNDPEQDRTGKASYLSETDSGPTGGSWKRAKPLGVEAFEDCYNGYLLWGEQWTPKTEPAADKKLKSGWSYLATGRIGTLPVPLPGGDSGFAVLGENERVTLEIVEYFGNAPGPAGDHGNMVVVEERLKRLVRYAPHKEAQSDE